jgi:hypothetical protein
LAEAGRIHSAIAKQSKSASGAVASALAAADQRVITISDLPPDKSSPDALGSAPKTIGGLRYLATAFHNLARAVDGADTAPSPDVLRGYAKHRALLNDALADWARFETVALARLNERLQTGGAGPITP